MYVGEEAWKYVWNMYEKWIYEQVISCKEYAAMRWIQQN